MFSAAVIVITGCVPNRRLVYLQHKDDPKQGEARNTDTTARVYNTTFEEYKLQPNDIITVRVASITPGEFDFVQKYEQQLGLIRKLNQYDLANKTGNTMRNGGGGNSGGQNGDNVMNPLMLDRQQTGFYLDEQGILELPYVGAMKLANLTIPQAEDTLKKKLLGYFETPVVRIQLMSFHFTILGEVNEEGRYTCFDPNPTIIDAISIASNLNDFADRSKIKVVRFNGQRAEVHYVNTLSEDLLGQPGFYLKPNDLIIVSPLKARSARKYTLPTYTTTIGLVTSTITFVLFLLSLNNQN